MTYVSDEVGTGNLLYAVEECGSVIVAHFSEGEFPVGRVGGIVFGDVAQAILGASVVAQPHIVSFTSEIECWCESTFFLISFIYYPAVSRVSKAMLQEDGWIVVAIILLKRILTLNSK